MNGSKAAIVMSGIIEKVQLIKSCWGINKFVKGTLGECDYCSSPIS
jgi:hypothetical protein